MDSIWLHHMEWWQIVFRDGPNHGIGCSENGIKFSLIWAASCDPAYQPRHAVSPNYDIFIHSNITTIVAAMMMLMTMTMMILMIIIMIIIMIVIMMIIIMMRPRCLRVDEKCD